MSTQQVQQAQTQVQPAGVEVITMTDLRRILMESILSANEEKTRQDEEKTRQDEENLKVRIVLASIENALDRYNCIGTNIKNVLIADKLLTLIDILAAALEHFPHCDSTNVHKAQGIAQRLKSDASGLISSLANMPDNSKSAPQVASQATHQPMPQSMYHPWHNECHSQDRSNNLQFTAFPLTGATGITSAFSMNTANTNIRKE